MYTVARSIQQRDTPEPLSIDGAVTLQPMQDFFCKELVYFSVHAVLRTTVDASLCYTDHGQRQNIDNIQGTTDRDNTAQTTIEPCDIHYQHYICSSQATAALLQCRGLQHHGTTTNNETAGLDIPSYMSRSCANHDAVTYNKSHTVV